MTVTEYTIDPKSIAYAHFVALVAFGVVSLICFGLVARFGRHSWWALIAVIFSVPTIVVLALTGAVPAPKIPVSLFFVDVVLPLALVGLPAALFGSALGSVLRKIIHSGKN